MGITFTLPYPPSKNRMWRTFRGRQILSKEGRDYYKETTAMLKATWTANPIDYPVRMVLTATKPDRRRRDVLNLTHAVCDALQYGGVLTDDELIWDGRACWRIDSVGELVIVSGQPVEITLEPIKEKT